MKNVGLPITAINLVGYLKGMVSVVCMGRMGRTELAGGALAVGFTNITGYSVLSGLALGMEPVCSQAFGSHNLPLVARTLRRTVILLLLASTLIALLWINVHPIMLYLRQDPEIARIAGHYCLFSLPDLAANSFLQPIRVYLRSKGTPAPMMWCMSLAVLLHVPLTSLLSSRIGIPGVAVATFVTNFNTLLFLLAYSHYNYNHTAAAAAANEIEQVYLPLTSPPRTETQKHGTEWVRLIRLALPSCLGVCLEWWWYELMTLAAGYLRDPHVALAAAAIVIQTTSLMYTLPITLSTTVSALVGNALGAGRPARARTVAYVSMGLAAAGSGAGLAWTALGRDAWGRVFTGDGEVLKLTRTVLPVIGLCELGNCPQTTGCGVLRGSARPSVGAAINFYSFYLVGAPVALLLAFVLDLGFLGLCFGLLAAQLVCAASVVMVTFRTDWKAEAAKAQDLAGSREATVEDGRETDFIKEVGFQT